MLWFAAHLGLTVDSMMDLICILGTFISFSMLLYEKTRNFLSFGFLWMLYFSLYQVNICISKAN